MKNKILILITIISSILLTGCSNYQIFDTTYTFDKIICNYDGDKFELKVGSWTDYDGEQIQVKSNGKTYLLSANNCYMVAD